jgi:aspartate aminotransferase-like enzyme
LLHFSPDVVEKNLFTPGPLNTHADTRAAMQKDYGSRDIEFINCIEYIRTNLVSFAGLTQDKYTCILMQGAGTMGVESVIGTTVPRDGKMLICSNGAYGDRIGEIAKVLKINAVCVLFDFFCLFVYYFEVCTNAPSFIILLCITY